VDRRLPHLGIEAATVLTVGRFRSDLTLSARRHTLLGQRGYTPVMVAQAAGEDIRRFDAEGVELRADDYRELVGFGGVERFIGQTIRVSVGAEGRWWHERDLVTRVERERKSVGVALSAEKLGASRERLARVRVAFGTDHSLAALDLRIRGAIGPVRLENLVRLGVGSRLPASQTFALGGDEGFPGMHIGERRGDREAFTSLTASRPLVGPIRFRITGAVGRTAFGRGGTSTLPAGDRGFGSGGLFDRGGWVTGVRAGFSSDSPLGAIRTEYGWSDAGRHGIFVRLGRWF
jgi:hypothetical protein